MNVKTLQDVIREYNSHEEELFDNATDLFISKVRNEFDKMYRNQEWVKMIGVSELGIFITVVSDDFKTVRFRILPFVSGRNGKDFQDGHDYPTFTEYIENEDYFGDELCNLEDEEILILKPYCKSLERKGFGYYVDTGDHELVVTLKIN